MRKTTKRILIAVCCIALAIIIAVSSVAFVRDIFQYNTGVVTRISAGAKNKNEINLKITYFLPMGGYSVRNVPEDEEQYISDGSKEYDGSLGKYRIMIRFGDLTPHVSFIEKISEDGTFELKNFAVPLKARFAFPSADHGFVLYIGSDTPIRVEEYSETFESEGIESIGGNIKIPILVEG